ncbi:MAG: 50S ribosomal protein L11 methyltransferase [Deltaproteobacteria bacterium]|nr:50S ribosomal protein L11 methyltransferase [Deltaproteobacteria bacterium]
MMNRRREPQDPSFVTLTVRAPDAAAADRLLAEAYEAGAVGCEEREGVGSGTELLLYVDADRAAAVGRALRTVAVDSEIGAPEPVRAEDWSLAWREGLAAVVVSKRLVVRPPFVDHPRVPGQAHVVIDPGQAFGTGGHESTRLALELVDEWLPRLGHEPVVLDVGTGSGVLAIAAAKLGARRALGFDLDPLATAAAAEAVEANDVAGVVEIATGGIEMLGPGHFDCVVANLLRKEVEPILGDVLERVVAGGVAIFTGLLESDRAAMEQGIAAHGLTIVGDAGRRDARGDAWIGLVARTAKP